MWLHAVSGPFPLVLLFTLLAGHALADYPLQGDFLAQAKNRNTSLGQQFWPWALPMHGFIHGGMVLLITGSLWLAMVEVALHCAIDWAKCEQRINFNTDQALHVACKLFYVLILTVFCG